MVRDWPNNHMFTWFINNNKINSVRMSDKSLFLNRFQIIKELGQGSYGLAVLAKDMDSDRKVFSEINSKYRLLWKSFRKIL